MKRALVTGASSGIGRDMAMILSKQGYEVILVARRKDRLEELAASLKGTSRVIEADLTDIEACKQLHATLSDAPVEVLINAAGFGLLGEFEQTDLDRELNMIDLNCKAVHTLTKLFLQDMQRQGHGYILNIASSAAFLPGPLMAAYYASKAYVLHLTEAIEAELEKQNSHVKVCALCPGPVETEFNRVAGVPAFGVRSRSSHMVAEYGLKKLFAGKTVIVPGMEMKFLHFIERIVPRKLSLKIVYAIQSGKRGEKREK